MLSEFVTEAVIEPEETDSAVGSTETVLVYVLPLLVHPEVLDVTLLTLTGWFPESLDFVTEKLAVKVI